MRFALILIAVLVQQGLHYAITSEGSRQVSSLVTWDLEGYSGQLSGGLAKRSRRSRGNNQRSTRPSRTTVSKAEALDTTNPTGWDERRAREGLRSGVHASPKAAKTKTTTGHFRDVTKDCDDCDGCKYDKPPVVPEGNYGVLISANNCVHCTRMYPIVQELKKQGYKVYVYNSSDYPKIKAQLNALDTSARQIGRGAPWFIVRSGGKTVKVFRGYRSLEVLLPHMKKPRDPKPDLKPAIPDTPDYSL